MPEEQLREALEEFCRAYAGADGVGVWMTQPIHDAYRTARAALAAVPSDRRLSEEEREFVERYRDGRNWVAVRLIAIIDRLAPPGPRPEQPTEEERP